MNVGGKQLLGDYQIITDGSMTGTSQITSTEIDARTGNIGSMQIKWTGTPNGTFTLQIPESFDTRGNVATWTTLPVSNVSGASLTATGSAGAHQIDLGGVPFSRMRLIYVNSSSTGTLNAWVTIKGV